MAGIICLYVIPSLSRNLFLVIPGSTGDLIS